MSIVNCPACKTKRRNGKLLPISEGYFHGHNLFTSASSDIIFHHWKCSHPNCEYSVPLQEYCENWYNHFKYGKPRLRHQKVWSLKEDKAYCPICDRNI